MRECAYSSPNQLVKCVVCVYHDFPQFVSRATSI